MWNECISDAAKATLNQVAPGLVLRKCSEAPGIYAIVNNIDGKLYVGGTNHLRKRRNSHRHTLAKTKHHCRHLQHAYDAYGEAAFSFVVLEECRLEDLTAREQVYLDRALLTSQCYNVFVEARRLTGGNHPMWGKKHTPEAIEKIRRARAKQTIAHSAETRAKIGLGNKGKKMAADAVERMRLAKVGRKNPWVSTPARREAAERKRVLVSQEMVDSLLKEYANGESALAIAKSMGLSWDIVRRVLIENGVRLRSIGEQASVRFAKRKNDAAAAELVP